MARVDEDEGGGRGCVSLGEGRKNASVVGGRREKWIGEFIPVGSVRHEANTPPSCSG